MRANDMALPFSIVPMRPVAEPAIVSTPQPTPATKQLSNSARKKLRREQEALERAEHDRRLQHFTEASVAATLHAPVYAPQSILERYGGDTDIIESIHQPLHPGAQWQNRRAQGPSHA